MRTKIRPGRFIGTWFERPISRLSISHLRDSAIFVAPPSIFLDWISYQKTEALHEHGADLLQTLLENAVAVVSEGGSDEAADFVLSDNPGELEALVNSEQYESVLAWRRASPFLSGEDSRGAFTRIFGDLLPLAMDLQVIDQFLLEQLMSRQQIWRFIQDEVLSFPQNVEIYSRSPNYDLRESADAKTAISDLEDVFARHGKKLTIHSFFPQPRANRVKFPHPRLQKIRFRRGEVFSSLDNGLNSLVLDGPSVFTVTTRKEWTDSYGALKLMRVNTVTAT